jgi:LPS-assembly protein
MRPHTLVFITLLALCHHQVGGQALTNALPASSAAADASQDQANSSTTSLPDDPGQEILPVAQPEPTPVADTQEWQFDREEWQGDVVTLTGNVVVHYRDYVLRADKVTYNHKTTELEADGHLQVAGGPNDILINASHGDMRLDMHTARFYAVNGTQGVRTAGHTVVYSTTTPLRFSARVMIQNGEGNYRLIDGWFTNCRLPHPDWRIIARAIALENGRASTSNSIFQFLGIPVFYLPYLRHVVAAGDRESGFLIPTPENSSVKGFVLGEQYYWAISRSMDAIVGLDYFSKRGWAPNGDFRYKGPGLDHVNVRWNGLFDRGVEEATSTGGEELVNQGGADILAEGSKQLSSYTRAAGTAEYLSSYVYRLVFNDNYSQATSSQVSSNIAVARSHNGFIPSIALERFENFASTTNGDEVRLLHLPDLRYDILDRPLGSRYLYWGLGSSLNYLSRSEPDFHARNVGRFDFYPHLTLPLQADGWSLIATAAFRATSYTISQIPDYRNVQSGVPFISHDPLNRLDVEADVDIRPPAMERDFQLPWNREMRHVIEPELFYRRVAGIGRSARNTLLFDTTDIVTDTDEGGYSLTQHFYLRRRDAQPCDDDSDDADTADAPDDKGCAATTREWASWQIAQKFFIDPTFGDALIPGRRNVFESTLDLTAIAFLTEPRNISPVISRLRFNAIDNLRIQWDLDYDPRAGRMDSDNLFAGYSFGRTTVGMVHSLLNAVDENIATSTTTSTSSTTSFVPGTLKSQIVEPFLEFGKPSGAGLNFAVNGAYDFAQDTLQYAGVEAVYNWDCCGLTFGYRRFELGTVGTTSTDDHEWLYGFTLANFGNVGDVRRANSIFHDPTLPPLY